MTLHLGLHGPHSQRNAEQQAEIREARRLLKERIRDDWDYPALPAYQVPDRRRPKNEQTVAGFRFHVHSDAEQDGQDFEALEWRERDYASSDSDQEEEIAVKKKKGGEKGRKGEVAFEGPDSVGAEIANRRAARRRKRRERLEEEMTWNDGMSHFMARRDAWCGARTVEQVRALETRRAEDAKMESASASASTGSTPRTSTSSTNAPSASTTATSPDPNIHVAGMTVAPPSSVLVPVTARIMPNHPIRRRISPGMYSEIYSKIILQSRTPSVPINLSNMIHALVQGWKDDGEWPPKSGPLEKSIGRRKGSGGASLKDGVKAVGRVLRITGGEGSVAKDKG